MDVHTQRTLGSRYVLERRIGAGGYSEVWRARDAVLDRPVAIKLLYTDHARHSETLARFRSEAQLAARLSHPNVAQVYDFLDSGSSDPPYLVMELIEGPSLADVLTSGPLDAARTMDVLAQAAAGLAAAHAGGLVHRDIKPANIMLTRGGTVKITDFGLSHTLASAPITGTGLLIGTPGYLAPERAAGARATPASDLYSLGVVGYECLAGAPPFSGTPLEVALAHRDGEFPPLPASTPEPVVHLIDELTARDPLRRPAEAGAVSRQAAELRDWLISGWGGQPWSAAPGTQVRDGSGSPPQAAAPWPDRPTLVTQLPPPETAVRARPSRRRTAALVVVAAVVAAALATTLTSLADRPGSGHPGPGNSPGRSSAVTTVDVSSAALVGEPVNLAVMQLRGQGFRVNVIWLASDTQQPGQVVAVQPAGYQPTGSLITLVAAQQKNGGKHDHSGDNGNGN